MEDWKAFVQQVKAQIHHQDAHVIFHSTHQHLPFEEEELVGSDISGLKMGNVLNIFTTLYVTKFIFQIKIA